VCDITPRSGSIIVLVTPDADSRRPGPTQPLELGWQSTQFDPDGTCIRTFVPELANVPTPWIHSPWTAPPMELASVGVMLGNTYPEPLIDHDFARVRVIAAYKATHRSGTG